MVERDIIYSVGGTVQASGGIYISRKADEELLSLCRKGDFAYVLASRQMGKSSLMVRTAKQLIAEGIRSVTIDLNQIGTDLDREEWYLGLLAIIEDTLMLETDAVEWWEKRAHLSVTHRLSMFLQEVLLGEIQDRVVIFIDEIDSTLSLPFTDDFFATIRYIYNARANTPELWRLSFVLIGVATPNDLISDPQRTPFNIGQRVNLTDFSLEEAMPLSDGLGLSLEGNRQVLSWVMKWTRGHPYLIQRLCQAIVLQNRDHWSEADIDRTVAEIFFGEMSEQDHNLQFVRDMLTKRMPGQNEGDSPVDPTDLLTTYREIRLGRSVPDEEQSLIKSHLKLSGVVRRESGELRMRNPIYQEVFNLRWVKEHMPIHWLKRVPRWATTATLSFFLVALLIIVFVFAQSASKEGELRRIAESQQERAMLSAEEAIIQARLAEQSRLEAVRAEEEKEMERQRAEGQARIAEERRLEAEKAKVEEEKQRKIAEEQAKIAEEQRLEAEKARESEKFQRQRAEGQAQLAEKSRSEAEKAKVEEEKQRKIAEEQAKIAEEQRLEAEKARELEKFQRQRAEEQAELAEKRRLEAEKAKQREEEQRKKAEENSQIILARNLSNQADLARSLPPELRILLAVESVKRHPSSFENVQILRDRLTQVADAAADRMDHQAYVYSIKSSPDGKYLATISSDRIARIWEMTSRQEAIRMGHESDLNSICFSPDGKYLATAGEGNSAWIWNASSGQEVKRMKLKSGVHSVAFSPDGRYLAVAGGDGTARIWEIASDQEKARMEHRGEVISVAFSPDGRYLVTAGSDRTARIWDIASTQEKTRMEHRGEVISVAFSPDGTYLATAANDNTAQVWEVSTGNEKFRIEHDDYLYSICFSPDGKYLAAASKDKTARIWRLNDGLEVARMSHQDEVYSVCFTSDSAYLATASRDKTARLWFLKPGDLMEKARSYVKRNLTQEEWEKYVSDTEPYQKTWQDLAAPGE